MTCDLTLKPRQTPEQRAEEVRDAIERLARGIAEGRVKPVVGEQGAIAFDGFEDKDRDGVSDACAYHKLLATASPLVLAEIERAEALAGRSVDSSVVGHGIHSHDGGRTWHSGH